MASNRNNKYQSYQSMVVPPGEEWGGDNGRRGNDDMTVSSDGRGAAQGGFSNQLLKRKHVMVGSIAALGLMSLLVIASRMNPLNGREQEIAWRNDLPQTFATKRKILEAQKTAEQGQQRLVHGPDVAAGFLFPGHSFRGGQTNDASSDNNNGDANNDNDHNEDEKKPKSKHKGAELNSTQPNDESSKTNSTAKAAKSKAPVGCEASVVIIRHCEKEEVREHCGFVGYERSAYITTIFGDNDERWPAPSYIYALAPSGRHNRKKMNFREIETVGALSDKVGVPVDYTYTAGHSGKLADELLDKLHSGEMCGKVALVSWKHSRIAHLASRLGCGPLQGCPMDYKGKTFDEVWQLKFVYREFTHSTRKSLKLPQKPEWRVFGSLQMEEFDPLAFSKVAGDYPRGGNHGKDEPGWRKGAAEIQERESTKVKDWSTDQSSIKFVAINHSLE